MMLSIEELDNIHYSICCNKIKEDDLIFSWTFATKVYKTMKTAESRKDNAVNIEFSDREIEYLKELETEKDKLECDHDFEQVAINDTLNDGIELWDCVCSKCGKATIFYIREE